MIPAKLVKDPEPLTSEPSASEVDRNVSLDRALVHGFAWTAVVKWSSQFLSWITTIVVARLLLPSDYGIVGMATVFIGFTSLITEFGIGSSLLVYRDLDDDRIAQLNTLAVAVGFIGFAASLLAAEPLSLFYRTPALRAVVIVLGLGFVIDSFRTIPNAILVRDLRFRESALLEATNQLSGSLLSIGLALSGHGYWALIYGNLAGAAVWTLVMLRYQRCRFAFPRVGELRDLLRFSGQVVAERAAWFGYSNADFVVAGRLLGAATLGAYTNAWTFANIPGEKILSLLQRVLPSIYSAAQQDPATLRRYFLLAHEVLAFTIFPLTIGIAVVAQDFVPVVFGAKWLPMIGPLRILALYVTLHTLATLPPQLLVIRGHARYMAVVSGLGLLLLPASFYIAGRRWGMMGIAYAWLTIYPIIVIAKYHRALRDISISVGALFASIRAASVGVAAMAVVVAAVHMLLIRTVPLPIVLAVEVLAGAAVYCLFCVTVYRGRLRTLRDLLRRMRRDDTVNEQAFAAEMVQ